MFVIARFKKEIPKIEGLQMVASFDYYQIFEVSDEAIVGWPENVPYEVITDIEGTTAWKFYGEVRPYRSAYSDIEGLTPDRQNSRGVNKTDVPYTDEIYAATLLLMKRFLKANVKDVFAERGNNDGEQDILDHIDSLTDLKDVAYTRERLLGTEMSKTQLQELYLWDDEIDRRKETHYYLLGI